MADLCPVTPDHNSKTATEIGVAAYKVIANTIYEFWLSFIEFEIDYS